MSLSRYTSVWLSHSLCGRVLIQAVPFALFIDLLRLQLDSVYIYGLPFGGGLFLVIHLFGGLTAYAGELNNCYCVYKIDSGFIVN